MQSFPARKQHTPSSSLSPCHQHPTPGCVPAPPPPHLLSHHLSLSHQLPGYKAPVCPPATRLLSPTSPALERVCVCVCVSPVCVRGPPASLPPAGTDPRPAPPSDPPQGARPFCPHGTWAVLVSSCISLFSPLSLCPSSDLDRDFWNNNESTVQQKWSSYPPKEFILNISPYAPYGDPRLSLK